jgi:NitT/TauT family transport system substrate-binding protein
LPTIRFIGSPGDDLVPLLYAQNNGLFKKAGVNVTIERAATGSIVAEAVVSGAADAGRSSLASLIAAHARGIPFVLVAPAAIHRKEPGANSGVVVATGSPVRSVSELQGKVVSCTAVGDIGYLGLRALIDAAGGDSSTVRWTEVPTPAVAQAIEQGRVDAGVTFEPFMSRDLGSGKVRVLVDMLNGYPGPILEGAFFTMRDYAEKNRDAIARFGRALREAAVYTNAHVAETVPLLVSYTGLDPTVAAQMHRAVIATSFEASMVQPIIDLSAKYKIIPQRFDAREMIAATSR